MAYKPKVLAVPEGGTNNTTFTAYSVLAAGTTATGAFQNVSGTGNSGQILTSNGASALPTWQNNAGISPNATVQIYDDFMGYFSPATTQLASDLPWIYTASVITPLATSTNTNPGVFTITGLSAGTPVFNFALCANATSRASILLGGGAVTVNWVIKLGVLSDVTNTYTISFGLGDTATTAAQANGCYFSYTNGTNSGNWVGNTAASSSVSTANSAVAATTTGFHNFGITINAAATSVGFFIDGTQIANSPLSTNIPTLGLFPYLCVQRTAGTISASSVVVDLFYLTQTLTAAR